jgi:hypothetical protein
MNPFWVLHVLDPFILEPCVARDPHWSEHVPATAWGSLRDNCGRLRDFSDGVLLLSQDYKAPILSDGAAVLMATHKPVVRFVVPPLERLPPSLRLEPMVHHQLLGG